MIRIYVDPNRQVAEVRKVSLVVETHRVFKVDFSKAASDKGTAVSSVAWSSEGRQLLTISNKTLANDIAKASVLSINGGWATLKVKATYADGQTEVQYVNIRVDDPERGSY